MPVGSPYTVVHKEAVDFMEVGRIRLPENNKEQCGQTQEVGGSTSS